MAGDIALSVDHLVKSFRIHQQKTNSLKQLIAARGRNRYDDFVAVDDVTFDVREGEVFGIIGQNGSGKSTLLKCMAGILQPNSGTVQVFRRMGALLELGAKDVSVLRGGVETRIPATELNVDDEFRVRRTEADRSRFLAASRKLRQPDNALDAR